MHSPTNTAYRELGAAPSLVDMEFKGRTCTNPTMQHPTTTTNDHLNHYELRFKSLFDEGRAYSFPCDVSGAVNMDALSDRARNNYLYARAVVGRELSLPAVYRTAEH
jgi:hypothetical protein